MTSLLERTPPPADFRIPYGSLALQFGDLRLPSLARGRRAPVVMFLHGGWWKAKYGLEYGGHFCGALKARGIATWSTEYRRLGDPGGGWPGTFLDVASAYDYLSELAARFPLDLTRVVVAGHSAGGHLAFWLAGRPHLPADSLLGKAGSSAPMRAVVSLAGAVDLRLTIDLAGTSIFAHDREEVLNLMGGTPADHPDRYRAGNPGDLLPLNTPQLLIQGSEDDQIPLALPQRWAERGRQRGENVWVDIIEGADHFDVVDPQSPAWPRVLADLERLLL